MRIAVVLPMRRAIASSLLLLSACNIERDEPDRVLVGPPTPPAIEGGTLMVTRAGDFVVASDPDRDTVWIMDWETREVRARSLDTGDRPGRIAEDASGRIHVALRNGGAVVSFPPSDLSDVRRTEVCAAPQGIDFDEAGDRLLVACADGTLVALDANHGVLQTAKFADDLRDVVVSGEHVYLSRFRSAEVLMLDRGLALEERFTPEPISLRVEGMAPADLVPHVAWRMVATEGGVALLHQRATTTPIAEPPPTSSAPYYASPITIVPPASSTPCNTGIVQASVTHVGPAGVVAGPILDDIGLAVDLAVDSVGAVVVNAAFQPTPYETVKRYALSSVTSADDTDCAMGSEVGTAMSGRRQTVAVAYHPSGPLVVQHREPALLALHVGDALTEIRLPGASSVRDEGHDVFHQATVSTVTCASCHPGGHEDGHVWNLESLGPRRTQSLLGGILETAPFHWDGDKNLEDIMLNTFFARMGGSDTGIVLGPQVGGWLDLQPTRPTPHADAALAERGREVFDEAHCGDCHSGAQMTNNENVALGSNAFQVPSLVGVSERAPYYHDGCAPTLEEALSTDGCVPEHGVDLVAADREALLAYLSEL